MIESEIKPNFVTYGSIIDYYLKKDQPEHFERLKKEMMELGIKPDVLTYSSMIDYYLKKINLNNLKS